MNGASVACDTASEALHPRSSATSPRSADAATKVMDAQSDPPVDPGNGDHPLAKDHPQQDIVQGVHKSKIADALNDLEEQHQHDEDSNDDELLNEKKEIEIDRYDRGLGDSRLKQRRERGIKYAKTTAVYVEGLETRVGWLEKEIVELQCKIGSRVRPDDESSGDESTLKSPCADALPLKAVSLSLKDWKEKRVSERRERKIKACFFLAADPKTSSLKLGSIHPIIQSQEIGRQRGDQEVNHNSNGHPVDTYDADLVDPVRLLFNSPWPSILIELLSGEGIDKIGVLIYPFKHIAVYEKQIRKCAELLAETDVDSTEAKDLSHNLYRIVSEVVHILGPKRDHFELSDTYVSNVLQKWNISLKNHLRKVKKSTPKDQEEEEPGDITAPHIGLSNVSQVPDPNKEVSERSNLAPEGQAPADNNPLMCTCLKDARDHLKLLVVTMDKHFGGLLSLRKAIQDRTVSKIRFEQLWHLFKPGDLVVTSRQPHQAYRVIYVSGGRPLLTTASLRERDGDDEPTPVFQRHSQVSPFNIDCVRLDFDGEKFGPIQERISVFEYEEDKMITKLVVYPMSYADKDDELEAKLLDRGRRFAEYRDFKHKRYAGLSLNDPQEEIESEVIIDFTQAFRQPDYAKYKPQIGLQGVKTADLRETYEDRCDEGAQCMRWDHNALVDDTFLDKLQMDRFLNVESHGIFGESREGSQTLSKDQLLLLPYRVHGFSLRSRNWVPLNIELLQDIENNDALEGQNSGFDDLVIPDEYKKIVKALVKSHALGPRLGVNDEMSKQQVDLIRGKGKGLIILLHGVPGVGKTSTAESVASYTRRPLFPITCGDIGQTAPDVERNLESLFLLARRWGCVLLLDEADVFLAKRAPGGDAVDRNALVSVFLRTLEYYSGILFLTTNRIGSFDEAFISRIHMSLYYADLDEDSTFRVWTMNLDRLRKSGRNMYVNDEQIKAFAKQHWRNGTDDRRWNGRQIRNAFQTAIALAEYEYHEKCQECDDTGDKKPIKPALLDRHFQAVADTSAEFSDYLTSVMGGQSYGHVAQKHEMRSDQWRDMGQHTPGGKKYSTARPVRPTFTGKKVSRAREQQQQESEPPAQQLATPPATPQLTTGPDPAGSGTSSSSLLAEQEEFRLYMEKKKQEEKLARFKKWEEEMEKAGK